MQRCPRSRVAAPAAAAGISRTPSHVHRGQQRRLCRAARLPVDLRIPPSRAMPLSGRIDSQQQSPQEGGRIHIPQRRCHNSTRREPRRLRCPDHVVLVHAASVRHVAEHQKSTCARCAEETTSGHKISPSDAAAAIFALCTLEVRGARCGESARVRAWR